MRSLLSLPSTVSLGLILGAVSVSTLRAVTVGELQQQLAQSSPATLIDIRSPRLFAQGHIVGAINIPASVLPHKNLPPLGKVIVYDGGLGKEDSEAAVAALAAKPGITAEALEGGFAAWESGLAQTTRAQGLRKETPNQISYAQLKALKGNDVVLVDLRSSAAPTASVAKVAAKAAPVMVAPLTDLAQEFPGRPIALSPFAASAAQPKAKAAANTPPLLVLIDNGDGVAQKMARTLEANGTKRYVILTGGELILARQGQSGLQRSGSASGAAASVPVLNSATTK